MPPSEISLFHLVKEFRRRIGIYISLPVFLSAIGVIAGFARPQVYEYVGLIEVQCISVHHAAILLTLYVTTGTPLDPNTNARIVHVKDRFDTIEVRVRAERPEWARAGLTRTVKLLEEKITRSLYSFISARLLDIFVLEEIGRAEMRSLENIYGEICGKVTQTGGVAILIDSLPGEKNGKAYYVFRFAILGAVAGFLISFLAAYSILAMRVK